MKSEARPGMMHRGFVRTGRLLIGVALLMGMLSSAGLWAYSKTLTKPGATCEIEIRGPFICEHETFTACYDGRTHNPMWVYEYITADDITNDVARASRRFRQEGHFPESLQGSHDDFTRSGYDRGHLAADANHSDSRAHRDDTYWVSNVTPQVGLSFNRNPGVWYRLEKYIREAVKDGTKAHIISGPLFQYQEDNEGDFVQYDLIGDGRVAVPTHFYKIIVYELPGGALQEEAYIFPNTATDGETPLATYRRGLGDVETIAGLSIDIKELTRR